MRSSNKVRILERWPGFFPHPQKVACLEVTVSVGETLWLPTSDMRSFLLNQPSNPYACTVLFTMTAGHQNRGPIFRTDPDRRKPTCETRFSKAPGGGCWHELCPAVTDLSPRKSIISRRVVRALGGKKEHC